MNKHQVANHVQLRDAKARLSALVSAAERGQETVITRHGKPVARIVPEPAEAELKRVDDPASPYHGMTFGELLMAFPDGIELDRDQTPMRDIDL
ncbi:MAG: type II toxin-antitoxin system prevent-host-death family antitoxin [Devosia sp.]